MKSVDNFCRYYQPMRFIRSGFDGNLVDYRTAWNEQREIHTLVSGGAAPTTLLVQHASVYTAGKRTASWDRPRDAIPVIDVDRGGRVTWHGPGQLVGYPIIRLDEPVDVVSYVRKIERALIDLCALWGIESTRFPGRSGVWIARTNAPWAKIAAIGVRVAKGVTMHGFALNASCDLSNFDAITPCGISDSDVTSLTRELGREISPTELLSDMEHLLTKHLIGSK